MTLHDTPDTHRRTIHFLHIRKAAGSQVRYLARRLQKTQSDLQIEKHKHGVNLPDLPRDADYFFSIRQPVSRFVSGFYSRKRKGQPRLYVEWGRGEKRAFEQFEHANDLAEALFEDTARGYAAFDAINAIRHTAKSQVAWFPVGGFFLKTRPPLAILRQEHFDADWLAFTKRLGLDDPPQPTTDATGAHRSDYSHIPPLTDLARRNLEHWYAQDMAFYKRCESWINQQEI